MAVEDDFAEFSSKTAATVVTAVSNTFSTLAATPTPLVASAPEDLSPWYALWERHTLTDFTGELMIVAILFGIVFVHIYGTRMNRGIAAKWMKENSKLLTQEFALVGFPVKGQSVSDDDALVKENSAVEFISYATGRQGIAFAHITFRLIRRNNPVALLIEYIASFFFDSVPTPTDTVTITLSPFDGTEGPAGNSASKYDNFIFGIVNKRVMRKLRDERYDLSLTKTTEGDINGLPVWSVVMSESNELSKIVTTDELKNALNGISSSVFDYLIATDQPVDKPLKLEETNPKKLLSLRLHLNSDTSATSNLLESFIHFVDHLAARAHFRPEVAKKIKATREAQSKKLRQQEEQEKAEEREQKRAEEKRKERDAKLRTMSAEEQKKFLDREKEKETRKGLKKMSRKG